ncbi:replication endonuclease, partial [Escherichia coli]|nr:replication endonuclease [Escherichia coli]EHS3146847.1 replication endonuclease [Escherichia coli]EHS3156101.1 replication endonuclease [Escherichia coli]EHS3254508.1 replication endonuclease [Escherichia coli]EHS3364424.1 replication endonuclease [Escherichia coli]
PYLSQDALSEFRAQREKTRDFLKSFMLENEDGFTIDLETVYYAGVSNPVHRKAEMMATMKGLELLAEARGDKAVFLTVTCPSKYHATTENGHPNPKWNGATMRDSSDYLVNTFFAAVRKKLNRDGLRWYGIRTVEPHHDGTVHWHMMVFAHPEEIDTIVSHTRDIAIQEDRHELGDDITPRFKAEYVDGSKGTPTSYIATYIGKNLDSRAVDGIDPKTGKPRVDHETGKSMTESVERAIGWARLHRVRQFQFFGIPSRQVWRELRRLASQMARNPEGPQRLKDDAMDAVLAAADAGCFATYIEKQGGVLVPRKDYLIRTAYDLADELNDYGEQSVQIYGIWSPFIGESSRVCTHPDNWKLVRRKPEAEDSARENGFDLQGGPAAPWTRGNNCPRVQETDNNGTEQPEERPAPWPQLPEGVDVNEWMRSLKRHERRALMRSLRDKQAKNSSDKMQNWTQSRKQPQPLPDNHELLAKEWRESAESLGLHIGEQQMQHLLRGGSLYVGGSIITPQGFEIVRKPDTRPDSRITQLWQRLSRNHGVSSTEIRHNPVASYLEQLEASDPEAAARLASTLQQDQNTMKTPVTVLSDMLRAIRDAEHAQRISETTKHARKKISLLHRTR